MMEKVKNEIYQSLEALFAEAAVDEMTGDMEGYAGKVRTVAAVTELLEIRTQVTTVSIDLKK